MKTLTKLLFVVLLCSIFMSCENIVEPELTSIKFIDDKTIEYHFNQDSEFTLGETKYVTLKPVINMITDLDGKDCKVSVSSYQTIGLTGKIFLSGNVPDGSLVVVDFFDEESDDYVYSVTFIK